MRREPVAALTGSNADNSANAGAFALNVNNSAANTNANISAALTHLTSTHSLGGLSLTSRSNIRRKPGAPSTTAASGADQRRPQDEPR